VSDETRLDRLEARYDRLEERVRRTESVDSPSQRAALNELHRLGEDIKRIDSEGSSVVKLKVEALERKVDAWDSERASLRRLAIGALLAAAGNIAVGLILNAIARKV